MDSNQLNRDGISPMDEVELSNSNAVMSNNPLFQRHGYRRMDSQGSVRFSPEIPSPEMVSPSIPSILEEHTSNNPQNENAPPQGLGISRMMSAKSRKSPSPPSPSSTFQSPMVGGMVSPAISQRPLLSPAWTTETTYNEGLDQDYDGNPFDEEDISRGRMSAFTETLDNAFESVEDLSQLKHPGAGDVHEHHGPHQHHAGCPANQDIHSRTGSWLSMSMLFLNIYSTIWSGIWFFIAVVRPRWKLIHTGGSLSPSTASIIFNIFAKSIELSFVTIFVTFLGQVLSRRSLVKNSTGVTVAELTMRTWVIQPGFMITNPNILRKAIMSFLGLITLTAACVAMFYTTASDALVNPNLQFGSWEPRVMKGLVNTSYGNTYYVDANCQTPITSAMDQNYSATTCVDIDHAGEAYHNFLEFTRTWAAISAEGIGNSTDLAKRPNVTAMLNDNTTVTGMWVRTNTSNMTASFEKYNRIVNNVTLAMPHSNVVPAAADKVNGILQPADLGGVGEYKIQASVVSPSVNVLCVNMNDTELSPLIYVDWPNAKKTNSTTIPQQQIPWSGYELDIVLQPGQDYLNSTVVDDIFGWGVDGVQPPVFRNLPIDYNMMVNISVWESPYIYVLAKSNRTTDYTVCRMNSFLSVDCSTAYAASGTGGALSTSCEDPNDKMSYARSVPDHPISPSLDARNILANWALSMSLNTGVSNDNASVNRILTQFVSVTPPTGLPSLNTTLPSLAEALASLSGCTLLISGTGATFRHYMGYSNATLGKDGTVSPLNIITPGQHELFNATVSSQAYTSGPQQEWQKIFYLVLILVFLTNIFCLGYFIRQRGLVTDFTETQNLFAIAVNSPPSHRLGGSCAAGPKGEQLHVDFHVVHEDDSGHFYLKEGVGGSGFGGSGGEEGFELRERRRGGIGMGGVETGVLKERTKSTYSRLSNKRRSVL